MGGERSAAASGLGIAIDERLDRDSVETSRLSLSRKFPRLSADFEGFSSSAVRFAALTVGIVSALIFLDPSSAGFLILASSFPMLALRCLFLFGVRGTSIGIESHDPSDCRRIDLVPPISDADAPRITILIPALNEGACLRHLLESIGSFDYPADRIQTLVLLESGDRRSFAAVMDSGMDDRVSILMNDGGPRTKPNALSAAMSCVEGDYAVVYDAEDVPHCRQLRAAASVFAARPDLSCLQARLEIYNGSESLVAEQFEMEYALYFHATLPLLCRFGFALPLSGSSNFFCVRTLRAAGGWDPYNVTEDADLGIRMARFGFSSATLESFTREESVASSKPWLRQRSRWLKGWIQTFVVHLRSPVRAYRDLGAWRTLGLLALASNYLLPALMYPMVLIAASGFFFGGGDVFGVLHATAGGFAFAIFFFSGMKCSSLRGRSMLRASCLQPLYWILSCAAAWRAVTQTLRDPYRWEKTTHNASSLSRDEPTPPPTRRPTPRATRM